MFKSASWGCIGVKVGFEDGLDLAQKIGFEGVDTNIGKAAEMVDAGNAQGFIDLYASRGLRLGNWGFPVNWRGDKAEYDKSMEGLPRLAKAAEAVGATRTATWIPPSSETMDLETNWAFHVERFGPAAKILADHGVSLGLEFIGPKTLRAGKPYEFVYDLPNMLKLCADIGPNVGLLLDAWHWYTSGGDEAQLAGLSADNVVVVHVNDAPAGIPIDEQLDNVRLLPAASGVIDIATFMKHLARMGYDGPVVVEPFNQELRDMDDEAAAKKTLESLDTIFAMV